MKKLIGGYFSIKELSERDTLMEVLIQDCKKSKEQYDNRLTNYYIDNPQWIDTYEYEEEYDVHFILDLFSDHEIGQDDPEILELSSEFLCAITVY